MSRYITKHTDKNQINLIPMSLDEMISEDNPVRVLDAFAESINLNKDECTKNKRGRQIIRGEYHDVMARTDERLANNLKLYKQRQIIVEHPFGTIKRTFGYTHFLLRGIEKVRGEAVMHCLMYNLKRVLNILGTKQLIAAIK